ncbi:MAG: prohibitin family protein [Candidatus Kapaibacteriota bacterium]|jgi:regulator of protease activity HflC (stomatin/prohibitin superfamily)
MLFLALGLILLGFSIFVLKSQVGSGKLKRTLIYIGALLVLIGFLTSTIRQVDAGNVGVQVLFGQVQPNVLYEGLNFVNPFIDVKEMSIQTQNYTMSGKSDESIRDHDDAIRVLSRDGLEVTIDLTVLYRIYPEQAPKIYREIGLNYQDKIIRPITRTGIRESATYYDAISLFSDKREEFEQRIRDRIYNEFQKRGIILERLLVRNITLPQSVKESIERKITAVQEAQRMEYVLQKERQEAERKRVEAQGIADAQRIINSGLSDKILQFELIKVQKELVNSPNSKIIILGGKQSPPFIIGEGK